MKIEYKELKNYPDVMSKEQLRIVCHISKRTALNLLQFGLIPNETTGKKTRCYRIKKSDVIAFMENREIDPSKCIAPDNWYKYGNESVKAFKICLIPELPDESQLREYYEQKLSYFQDVMSMDEVIGFTGYNRRIVGNWIREGTLKGILYNRKYIIPKAYLVDWICSDAYNNTNRKSEKHTNMLWDITRQYVK